MDLTTAVRRYNAALPIYQTYRAYSRGEHELKFTDTSSRTENGKEMKSLRENLCNAVITSFVDKLSITSWGSDANNKLAETAGLDRLLNVANSEAFRCGTSFIVASKLSSGRIMLVTQHAEQVVPVVDDLEPDTLAEAWRCWVDVDGYPRLTKMDKTYVQDWKGVKPLEQDPETGAIKDLKFPTTDAGWEEVGAPKPHGFTATPVCQLKQDADGPWDMGVSILADVIPLQDVLNKHLADGVVLSSQYSRPFWYLLNYQPSAPTNPLVAAQQLAQALNQLLPDQVANGMYDTAGQGLAGAGRFNRGSQTIFTHDGAGPFGQLTPPDMDKVDNRRNQTALSIARVVGMPAYYLTQTSGDIPSGASLRVLTSRMTARVNRYQLDATPVLKGLGELLGMAEPKPDWADASPMDETERVAVAVQKKRDLGYAMEDAIAGLDEPDARGIVERATAAKKESQFQFMDGQPMDVNQDQQTQPVPTPPKKPA